MGYWTISLPSVAVPCETTYSLSCKSIWNYVFNMCQTLALNLHPYNFTVIQKISSIFVNLSFNHWLYYTPPTMYDAQKCNFPWAQYGLEDFESETNPYSPWTRNQMNWGKIFCIGNCLRMIDNMHRHQCVSWPSLVAHLISLGIRVASEWDGIGMAEGGTLCLVTHCIQF